MNTRCTLSKIGALALPIALLASAARAQAPRTVYLFSAAVGQAASALNAAQSGPWGNGAVGNGGGVNYEGGSVLRLTTRNLQEGVRFDLNTPVDIDAYRDNGFLRFRLRFQDAGGFGGGGFGGRGGGFGGGGFGGGGGGGFGGRGGGGFGGGRGGRGGRGGGGGGDVGGVDQFQQPLQPQWRVNAQEALPPFGGGPGGFQGGPGGFPGGGFPGGGFPGAPGGFPGGNGLPAGAAPQQTNITELSVTLLRDTGASRTSIPINLRASTPDDEGWRLFVVPIKNLTSTPGAAGPVRRMIITSDKEDSFYLAQAAFVIETGQMTAAVRRAQDPIGAQVAEVQVKPGRVTFVADVEAGAADPSVEWNFDADNVGNLPPAAISGAQTLLDGNAPDGAMMGGMPGGMMGGMAGMGRPGAGGPMAGPGGVGGMGMPGVPAVPAGPRIDARGLTATFEYPNEEQNYRVEITVRDRSGKKPPVTASILVQVRG